MQIQRTQFREFARDLCRVVAVLRGLVEIALVKTHALAVLQVDRRNQVHDRKSRKFCNNRDPAADERSG